MSSKVGQANFVAKRSAERQAKRESKALGMTVVPPVMPQFELSATEIIQALKANYARKKAHEEARRLITVKIPISGPIGILHFGDPHVDDDGTDWAALERDIRLVQTTPGLYASNIGDTTNNWIGRLGHLYGQQSTTARQAWTLAEWFIKELTGRWLYLIGGNHDCHDDQTEALTRRGWVKGLDIREDDEVLSFDHESGFCTWAPILKTIRRHHVGEMVKIKSRSVDLMVTPNHRILCKSRRNQKWTGWEMHPAGKLPCRVALPVNAGSLNLGVDLSDDQIRLCGWLLTDGNIHWMGKAKNCPRITFYQSKDGSEIERLLESLGLEHRKTIRHRFAKAICGRDLVAEPMPSCEWSLTAEASRAVLGWMPEKGTMPKWANDLNDAQFSVMLESIIAGDGTWDGSDPDSHRVAVVHGTEQFLSSLQSVAVQHGWYARMSIARGKDSRLNLCRRPSIQFETKDVTERIQYNGEVWCLTVPLGNFMVRRNGMAHFSGNCWAGDSDPLRWITSQCGALYEASEARVGLAFPNGKSLVINARHDFAGGSMWNPTHGPMKAAQLGVRDEVVICGHKHKSGYSPLKDPETGKVMHCIQVASYKRYDRYAKEKGFRDQSLSPCVVTVINPDATDPVDLCQVFWNPQTAADYLTFLRGKVA